MLGPAGAIWPYKFVTAILDILKTKHQNDFHIETRTPVLDISVNPPNDTNLRFAVHTSRGTVRAKHVIHCTNAHVGNLVPGLRGNVYPIRGQMSAQLPGDAFHHQGNERSWLFIYDCGFDYLTQLPHDKSSQGEMMLGGGFAQSIGGGIADIGIATDDKLSLYADIHLSGALSAVFRRDAHGRSRGTTVKQMWTGNMCFSADGLPWVGVLPPTLTGRGYDATSEAESSAEGAEWAAVAYSGEGMVQAWLCGKALALMMIRFKSCQGWLPADEPNWLPEQMLITKERAKSSRLPSKITL